MSYEGKHATLAVRRFAGKDGVALIADAGGDPSGIPVLFLHGGGQTRHSWGSAARALARQGYYAVAVDQRGHGDSDWSSEGDYSLTALSLDIIALCAQLPAPPVIVGASLGGIAGLIAVAEADTPIARALVLVDVTPRIEQSGRDRILAFMRQRPEGFASLDEVADAVASYVPGRPRPKDKDGLLKNVRLRDGRYFWHWDPALLEGRYGDRGRETDRLEQAAQAVDVPMLLIRGKQSDIVSVETAEHLRHLAPHAEFVDIAEAGHMVAGDKNDAFNAAVFSFLDRHGFVG